MFCLINPTLAISRTTTLDFALLSMIIHVIMVLHVRIIWLSSKKVKFLASFHKPFDSSMDPWLTLLCFGHFC